MTDPMIYRSPDFDLRPRRLAPAMPMWSTMQVDDDDDRLDALAATTIAQWNRNVQTRRDARHIALSAMPSTLCTPTPGAVWAATRRPARRRNDRVMLGSIVSAALAVLMLVAAMFWRLENPRVVHVEGATPAIQVTGTEPLIDAMSSASP
jgi:hypothetical protein